MVVAPSGRRRLRLAVTLLLIGLAVLVLATANAGRPVLAYAVSGSMEPTIGTGDAYVVNPFARAFDVGDIVVFHSVQRGDLAVHRIVGGAPAGWITQGDANTRTDQDTGEPLVTSSAIRGRVLEWPDGSPVLIPGLGRAVMSAQVGLRAVQMATGQSVWVLTAVALGAASLLAGTRRTRARHAARDAPARRWRRRPGLLGTGLRGKHVHALTLLGILVGSAVLAHTVHERVHLSLVITEDPPKDSPRATTPGGALPRTVEARNGFIFPAIIVLDPTDRVHLDGGPRARVVPPGGGAVFPVTEHAGHAIGLQEDVVSVRRYPAVLPPSVTLALHDTAPGLPWVVTGTAVALALHPLGRGVSGLVPRLPGATRSPEVKP